jgi:hypothetical protein
MIPTELMPILRMIEQNPEPIAGAIVTVFGLVYRRYMNRRLSSRTMRFLKTVLIHLIRRVITRVDPAKTKASRNRNTVEADGDPETRKPPQKAERNRETLESDGEAAKYDVTIHTSKSLAKSRGRTAERVIAQALARNLDRAGVGYRIAYGFERTPDTSEVQTDDGVVSTDVLNWWKDEPREYTAADSNLLRVDNNGGGWGAQTGKFAISGANRIDRFVNIPESLDCPKTLTNYGVANIRAGIHEFGHNVGGSHDTPMLNPSPSIRYTQAMIDILRGDA